MGTRKYVRERHPAESNPHPLMNQDPKGCGTQESLSALRVLHPPMQSRGGRGRRDRFREALAERRGKQRWRRKVAATWRKTKMPGVATPTNVVGVNANRRDPNKSGESLPLRGNGKDENKDGDIKSPLLGEKRRCRASRPRPASSG